MEVSNASESARTSFQDVADMVNSSGWKAPRNSTQIVYPEGLNVSASDDDLNISFRPTPNFAAMAEAITEGDSGWKQSEEKQGPWTRGMRVRTVRELKDALERAKTRLIEHRRGSLVEAIL